MPTGGHIVFVTSHQGHFFPYKAVPKGHTAIAASQQAGEATLHAMRPEFHRAGVHFTVLSGDTADATFAAAIANAANTPNPSGIVYVGGRDHLMTASSPLLSPKRTNAGVVKLLGVARWWFRLGG